MSSWQRATFKGKKVWIAVDVAGEPAVTGGRVAMRYSDRAGAKVYRAGIERVSMEPGEPVELDDGVSADAAPSKASSRSSGFGSAGTRSAAQAAMAAEAARALIASLPEDTAVAFTDGACRGNPGAAGSGAHVRLPDGRSGEACLALGHATNNVAELSAIGLALDLLEAAGVSSEAPVALFTDSKYTNGVLCLGWKAKANRELILALRERVVARSGLQVHWIAGHVGIDGNERADALANQGVAGVTETRWSS